MPEVVPPSVDTPPPFRRPMQLVGETATPDPPTLSSLIGQNPAKTETSSTAKIDANSIEAFNRGRWKAGVLGSLNVLFVILAVRAILLVAVVGAIYLTIIATTTPDPWRMAAVAVYAVIVVVPLTWLAARK